MDPSVQVDASTEGGRGLSSLQGGHTVETHSQYGTEAVVAFRAALGRESQDRVYGQRCLSLRVEDLAFIRVKNIIRNWESRLHLCAAWMLL